MLSTTVKMSGRYYGNLPERKYDIEIIPQIWPFLWQPLPQEPGDLKEKIKSTLKKKLLNKEATHDIPGLIKRGEIFSTLHIEFICGNECISGFSSDFKLVKSGTGKIIQDSVREIYAETNLESLIDSNENISIEFKYKDGGRQESCRLSLPYNVANWLGEKLTTLSRGSIPTDCDLEDNTVYKASVEKGKIIFD